MATIKIPTPLRPYAGNNGSVSVSGATVGEALRDLARQHPGLESQLFNDGELRSFVNIFLGEEDIRYLDGENTQLKEDDRLMIIPSIAGGSSDMRYVDQSALRTNQAFIIAFLLLAFVLDLWLLVAFVSAVMLIGTLWPQAGLFKRIYRHVLKPGGLVKPDVIPDNPEPHRFAQALGGVFTLGAVIAFLLSVPLIGWALAWVVIVLAVLNLFLGFCAGCFVYYQLNRWGIPGFVRAPLSVKGD